MPNLTITVDEDVLQRARIRALTQGTSLNAVLRGYLEAYSATSDVRVHAIESLLALSARSRSRRGDATWTRESLHER